MSCRKASQALDLYLFSIRKDAGAYMVGSSIYRRPIRMTECFLHRAKWSRPAGSGRLPPPHYIPPSLHFGRHWYSRYCQRWPPLCGDIHLWPALHVGLRWFWPAWLRAVLQYVRPSDHPGQSDPSFLNPRLSRVLQAWHQFCWGSRALCASHGAVQPTKLRL